MDLVSSVGSDMGLLGGTPEMNRHEDASRHHQASGWPGGGGGKDRIPLSDQTAPGGTFRLAGLASALPEAPPPGVTLTPRSYQRHRASRVQVRAPTPPRAMHPFASADKNRCRA